MTLYRYDVYYNIWKNERVIVSGCLPLNNAVFEKFAQNVVSGKRPGEAYSVLYPDATKRSCTISASRLMAKKEISDRINYLKRENAQTSAWSRAESMEILRGIANDPDEKSFARIRAVEVLNEMCGFNQVKQNNNVVIPITFISPERGKDEPG